MLRWALLFLVMVLIAAALGFNGIAGQAAWIARVLVLIFSAIAVVSLFTGTIGRPPAQGRS